MPFPFISLAANATLSRTSKTNRSTPLDHVNYPILSIGMENLDNGFICRVVYPFVTNLLTIPHYR